MRISPRMMPDSSSLPLTNSAVPTTKEPAHSIHNMMTGRLLMTKASIRIELRRRMLGHPSHLVEDPFVPSAQYGGFTDRVVPARRGQDGGQPGRFFCSQVVRRLLEVMARGSFGSVHADAPLRDVEIQLKNAIFSKMVLEEACDQGFSRLAKHRSFRGQVQVLCELLGDGTSATFQLAGFEVGDGRVLDAFPIESFMPKERRVLRGHDGEAEIRRDVCQWHPLPVASDRLSLVVSLCFTQIHERGG